MNMFRTFIELDEAYNDRQYFIDELKKAGKNYNFDKYTDAQLYRMCQRLQQPRVVVREPKHELDLDFEPKRNLDYCECGVRLTDFGACPICDLGEEDLIEGNRDSIFANKPTTSNWIAVPSKSPQAPAVTQSQTTAASSVSTSNTTINGNTNGKYVVRIVSYHGRLRALATDGMHPAGWVAFPNNLRQFEGQEYEVDQLIWNGKNYRVAGNIVEI